MRARGSRKMLVVVPYAGEFGWELMNWQGRARWAALHGDYESVVICGRPDRQVLYVVHGAERRTKFCPVRSLNWPGQANDDHRVDERGVAIDPAVLRRSAEAAARRAGEEMGVDLGSAEFMAPDYRSELWPTTPRYQVFGELRQAGPIATDVLLVPRRRSLAAERNQPRTWWEDLASELIGRGLSVDTYPGSFNTADPSGATADYPALTSVGDEAVNNPGHGSDLEGAIGRLSGARLAVGASTGGLHLASLCRCPHYVWGSGPEARWTPLAVTNRQRYETLWNPLGTPCRYDECGWRPDLTHVVDGTLRAFDDIGLRKERGVGDWAWRPKWRVKRGLVGLLRPDRGAGLVPWRVRRFVRERVV